MKYFYCLETKGFYTSHNESIPKTANEISQRKYFELVENVNEGNEIHCVDGELVLIERELTIQQKSMAEILWRDIELKKVLNRIDQYEKDQNYPIELRTSPIRNEVDFHRLLADRKALSDYPAIANFPFSERPMLSGLGN